MENETQNMNLNMNRQIYGQLNDLFHKINVLQVFSQALLIEIGTMYKIQSLKK